MSETEKVNRSTGSISMEGSSNLDNVEVVAGGIRIGSHRAAPAKAFKNEVV